MRGKKIPPSFFQDSVWKSQELPRRIRAFRTRTARTLAANVSSRCGRTRRQNLRSFGRRGTRIAAVSYQAAAPGGSWSEPLRDEVR